MSFTGFVRCLYELLFTRYVEPPDYPPQRPWTDGTF